MLENGTGDEDELILPIFFFFSLFFLNKPPHYLLHFAFPIYTFSFPFLTLPGCLGHCTGRLHPFLLLISSLWLLLSLSLSLFNLFAHTLAIPDPIALP